MNTYKGIQYRRERIGGKYYLVARDRGKFVTRIKWSSKLDKRTDAYRELFKRIEGYIGEGEGEKGGTYHRYTVVGKLEPDTKDYFSIHSYLTLSRWSDEKRFVNELHIVIVDYYLNFMDVIDDKEGWEGDFEIPNLLEPFDDGDGAAYSWDLTEDEEENAIKYYIRFNYLDKEVYDFILPPALRERLFKVFRKWGFNV